MDGNTLILESLYLRVHGNPRLGVEGSYFIGDPFFKRYIGRYA